jgi:hypothetical protein
MVKGLDVIQEHFAAHSDQFILIGGTAATLGDGASWVRLQGHERSRHRPAYRSSHSRIRTWQLTAPALDGPEIPCMAAILLARRLARGEVLQSGAFPCVGFLTLSEFAP